MQLLGGLDRLLARVGKRVVHVEEGDGVITVEASNTVRATPCPVCRRWSDRVHGSYVRYLQERPVLEKQLVLAVQMRRFKCLGEECARRTFAEFVTPLAGRHQRRTRSQARALQALGHALGGEPAARLAAALGLSTSADTVLRHLRRATVRRRRHKPRVVGIDDWAIARGHNYGTIVVDLERREPIEVFAGREATAVTQWLRRHPSIEIVARDRAGAYSEAVDIALPHAEQVSDRWHLLSNLRDNVERMLQRMGPQMREGCPKGGRLRTHPGSPRTHPGAETDMVAAAVNPPLKECPALASPCHASRSRSGSEVATGAHRPIDWDVKLPILLGDACPRESDTFGQGKSYTTWRWFKLDNAKANLSEDVRHALGERVGVEGRPKR